MQLLMFTEEGAHSTLDPDCRLSVNYPNFPQMIEIHPTNFLKRLRPNQELHPLTNSSSKQHYLKTVHRYVAPQGCVSQEGMCGYQASVSFRAYGTQAKAVR